MRVGGVVRLDTFIPVIPASCCTALLPCASIDASRPGAHSRLRPAFHALDWAYQSRESRRLHRLHRRQCNLCWLVEAGASASSPCMLRLMLCVYPEHAFLSLGPEPCSVHKQGVLVWANLAVL